MRISCKGPLSDALYFYCFPRKPILCFSNSTCGCLHSDVSIEYVTAPVSLTESVFSKHFTIWRMTQNHVKNIIGNVASSYQVNLAIKIPDINQKLHKFAQCHLSTSGICNAYLNIRHMVGKFFWLARYFSIWEGSKLTEMCQENLVWNWLFRQSLWALIFKILYKWMSKSFINNTLSRLMCSPFN